jgi:hypothetical protein
MESDSGHGEQRGDQPTNTPALARQPEALTTSQLEGFNVRTWAGRLRITPRAIQIALGLIWILDAALQYQPKMFGSAFVNQMILANAKGQPTPIAWSINHLGHWVLPDVGVWNFLFATTQLVIGIGLLTRRWARPALVLMFAWCFGVWWFGEGFGQLLTGQANPLTGAPGAVTLYAAIGVLVWPRKDREQAGSPKAKQPVGVASSAAGHGPFGARAALGVWSGFWILSAVLWLFPANRASTSVHDAISNAASGQPGWYAHFLNTIAPHFAHSGAEWAWVLALLSLVIGLGPLFTSRSTPFFLAGSVVALAFWITGMAVGSIMTGMGTDPQTAILVVLLAVSMLPAVVPIRGSIQAPVAALLRWNPAATFSGAGAVFAAILLSATYPVASTAASASPANAQTTASSSSSSSQGNSGSSGMSGMAGMPGMSSGSMKSSAGGSSNGSSMDMSGMAGMGGATVQAPNWHYTGPPLPSSEVALLSSVNGQADSGHVMQTPNCTANATSTQTLGAFQYVQATTAAVAKYKDINVAKADGYIPITDTAYPVVHYINLSYMKSQYVMDPNHVQSLVYANTPYGSVLVAAMYLMPRNNDPGPMPYGCLVQWHAHSNLCMNLSAHEFTGFTPCAPGTFNLKTQVMTHVWQVPVAGGPLAIDPSDLQVVQAAVEAQVDGQAPMQYPAGNAPAQAGPPGTGF